jgi:sugar phosphate isomerase/epimerase
MTLSRREFLAAAAVAPVAATMAAAPSPAKFKLGLVTYNVAKDWDLPTILRIAKAAGIAAVELRTTHKHGVEPSLTADERKRVKGLFADAGVAFFSCGTACEYHDANPAKVKEQIEQTKAFLQLAADLGGKGIKVRPNGVAKGHTVEQACTQIGTALKTCGTTAADLGLEVQVEVHGGVTQIPKNMKAMMDACGHKSVGITWNSNPTDMDNAKSIAANFDLLKSHIMNVHINDLANDAAGKYPYRDLFARLKSMTYDRYTMIEYAKDVPVAEGEAFLKSYMTQWVALVGG